MMNVAPLGELIRIAKIERLGAKSIPALSLSGKNGLVSQNENSKFSGTGNTRMHKVVRRNQLVTGIHMNEGSLGLLKDFDYGYVSSAYDVWDITSSEIIPEYLESALLSDFSLEYFKMGYTGTIKRRGNVPRDLFLKLKIPLPNKEEQRRVVDVLKTISDIKNKMVGFEKLISGLDQSIYQRLAEEGRFLKLTDAAKVSIGQSPKESDFMHETDSNAVPFYQGVSDFGRIFTKRDRRVAISPRVTGKGSLLFTVREPIGELNITHTECGYGRGLAAISPVEGISNTPYLYSSLRHIENRLPLGNGIIRSLNMKHMNSLEIPIMSLSDQDRFSILFDKILQLTDMIEKMNSVLEILHKALYTQYFNKYQANG